MSNKYSASLSAQTNFTIHRRVTATCKLEKYTIKKGNLSRHFDVTRRFAYPLPTSRKRAA